MSIRKLAALILSFVLLLAAIAPIASAERRVTPSPRPRPRATSVQPKKTPIPSSTLKLTRKQAEKYKGRIDSSSYRTVGLKASGTVVAAGYDDGSGSNDVGGWRDITAVIATDDHTVGLKSDGTVVMAGSLSSDEYIIWSADEAIVPTGPVTKEVSDVAAWRNIVAISSGSGATFGIKSNGTVVATQDMQHPVLPDGGSLDISGWRNIVAIDSGAMTTIGVKSDGTVVSVGLDYDSKTNMKGWKDIVDVSTGGGFTIGLKSDGTVVAAGAAAVAGSYFGEIVKGAASWRDIVAIAAGDNHILGLKSDGTVVAAGYDLEGQLEVDDWRNIVAISAGFGHSVGLQLDGTVVAAGSNDYGQTSIGKWKLT